MGSVGSDGAGVAEDEMPIERNAGLIMATNIATTAFKGSAERFYLPKPHFHKFFVKKLKRVSPAINRGSWLRMRAIEWVIGQFLEKPSIQKKVIINLGCGYDPLPFKWLSQKSDLCTHTKFVDVDYEPLMQTKREIIMRNSDMRSLLHAESADCLGSDPSIVIDSEEYAAIGCDLRNLRRLERLLKSVVITNESAFLCIAEDSIVYMHVDAADALISWSSALSEDTTFCLLEPNSPDQPDNPFTATMTKHYTRLGTPLRSLFKYSDDRYQTQRFANAGFPQINYQNLWELWADPRFLSPSQRMKLDHVEPFDDWEEFALYASHYCLVVAHTRGFSVLPGGIESRRDSVSSDASDISARTSSPNNPAAQVFAFRYYKDPGNLCQRHHGSTYPIPDQDAIAIFGGAGRKVCLSTSAVCRPRHLNEEPPIVLPPDVGARCCHVITAMNNGDNILVGGRLSPTQPLKDCWLQKGHTWYRMQDLPEPRYRHRIAPVTLPNNIFGAICFGGKVGPCKVATDVLLWEPCKGWQELRLLGKEPRPRFGPTFIRIGFNHGLLFGGMRQDGVICQGFWRWRLVIRDNVVCGLKFRPSNALDASIGSYLSFARFGASYGFVQDYLLIIGGIAKSGCIPRTYEILSLSGNFATLPDEVKEPCLKVATVEPLHASDCPRPFLIGHSTHRTRTGMYIIMGGGATCFNFGTYFNRGIWVLHEKEAGISADWIIVPTKASNTPGTKSESSLTAVEPSFEAISVEAGFINNPEDFLTVTHRSQPTVMKGLDFGRCTQLWSPNYFKSKISSRHTMSIHSDPFQMNRQSNAVGSGYMTFHQYLDEATAPATEFDIWNCSSTCNDVEPPLVNNALPELANDFQLPTQLNSITSSVHSVRMQLLREAPTKLSYDVMAKVVVQVHGVRKLFLFPPKDLHGLEFPAGSTTSDLDLLCNKAPDDGSLFNAPSGTCPYIAVLRPGDSLFIPPFWCQTAVTLADDHAREGFSSNDQQSTVGTLPPPSALRSSNIRDFSKSPLAIKRSSHFVSANAEPSHPHKSTSIAMTITVRNLSLNNFTTSPAVNGTSELAAYQDGRQDLEKILKRFTSNIISTEGNEISTGATASESAIVPDGLPRDVAKAYLRRLGKELLMKADEL